ncbi:hypothetical protein [Variovorax fucosicus]|uniref:hypothetical protein n=1 Tax=Variovorax fucosicus TaxID=3053517 RepID=UPI002574DF3B|nr:hypothetical protein [Variovorax sp. J22G47]MDM0059527.1 hypothetical protein [Variovorax sp. J22G47]
MNWKIILLSAVLCSDAGATSIRFSQDVTRLFEPRSSIVAASAVRSLVGALEQVAQKCATYGVEVAVLGAAIDPARRTIAVDRNESVRRVLIQLGVTPRRIYEQTFDLRRPPMHLRNQVTPNAVEMQVVCIPG